MKCYIFSILVLCHLANSQVYINEIDYDQPSTDSAEFIELIGPDGTSLDEYTIELVNGANGSVYKTIDLTGYTIPNDNVSGKGFFVIGPASGVANVDFIPDGWTTNEIQNGTSDPDGILLKKNGVVVDGFSYEGEITNNSDFTSGMAISASENNSSPNLSIGRISLGYESDNQDQFFASSSHAPSPGEVNSSHGQSDKSLPVTLTSFTATAGNKRVTLRWVTESEIENLGFELWRSLIKSGDYLLISSYESNPELQGHYNSNTCHEYEYVDPLVVNGKTYWYKLMDVDLHGVRREHGPICATPNEAAAAISVTSPVQPERFKLYQNYPNPFNPGTTLRFDIPPHFGNLPDVSLVIYNALGQQVKILFEGKLAAGQYEVQWQGETEQGRKAPGGIYFASLQANGLQQVVKLLLLK